MTSVFIALPVPQVPVLLGVPALPLSLPGAPPLTAPIANFVTSALSGDAAGFGLFGSSPWGIYSSPEGSPILEADAVASVEYARDYRISDYQQEKGAFESYNKVQLPYTAKVGFLIAQSRVEFLNSIEAILASLDLFAVVTPEITYPNANMVHYGYRRTVRDGVTMILVEVWLEEVRQTADTTLNMSNAQSINGQPTQQNGTTQAGDASAPAQSQSPTPQTSLQGAINSNIATNQANAPLNPTYYQGMSTSLTPATGFYSGTDAQQQTIGNLGTQTGSSAAYVTPPDGNGNVLSNFSKSGFADEGPF